MFFSVFFMQFFPVFGFSWASAVSPTFSISLFQKSKDQPKTFSPSSYPSHLPSSLGELVNIKTALSSFFLFGVCKKIQRPAKDFQSYLPPTYQALFYYWPGKTFVYTCATFLFFLSHFPSRTRHFGEVCGAARGEVLCLPATAPAPSPPTRPAALPLAPWHKHRAERWCCRSRLPFWERRS